MIVTHAHLTELREDNIQDPRLALYDRVHEITRFNNLYTKEPFNGQVSLKDFPLREFTGGKKGKAARTNINEDPDADWSDDSSIFEDAAGSPQDKLLEQDEVGIETDTVVLDNDGDADADAGAGADADADAGADAGAYAGAYAGASDDGSGYGSDNQGGVSDEGQ